jgi:S1-C subfamily serine protease
VARVVGINTALIASAHGIGFAVAANDVKPALKELMATGRVVRPSLEFEAVSVTPQVAYANDLPVEGGALVLRVEPGGAAEAAGLEAGDVITAIGGESIEDLHHLHRVLMRRRIGDAVDVTLWRDGRSLSLRPTLGAER